MPRRTVNVRVLDSSFIDSVSHDGRGTLTVGIKAPDGRVARYGYAAPIAIADQADRLARYKHGSFGKWYNHGVKGVFERR